MTRTNTGRPRSSIICAALLVAAALFGAGPAAADDTDDAFISALAKNGIDTSDPSSAITMGHNVCSALDSGHDSSFVLLDIVRTARLPARQAGYFLGVSVAAYCPQYKGTLDPSLTWLLPGFLPQL